MDRKNFVRTSGLTMTGLVLGRSMSRRKSDSISVGVLGTGGRGLGLALEMAGIDGLEAVAGCDILPFRLADFGQRVGSGVSLYDDYRRIIERRDIEAVVIATPLHLHYPMVMDALEAGKHVYCEKTMAYSIEETLALVSSVRQSAQTFQVGHQYRQYPMYHAVKAKIQSGDIGEVKHFSCSYHLNSQTRRPVPDATLERTINWRFYREYSGGLAAELTSHQLDIINYLLGAHPEKFSGFCNINRWPDGREMYDNLQLLTSYPAGITGSFSCRLSNAHQPFGIKIYGTTGTIEIHRNRALYYAESMADSQRRAIGTVDGVTGATLMTNNEKAYPIAFDVQDGSDATTYALMDFVKAIREGKRPDSDIESGARASICVHLANRAMETEQTTHWLPEYNP